MSLPKQRPPVPQLDAVRVEFQSLWDSMTVRADKAAVAEQVIARCRENQARYRRVADEFGIPWAALAAIHQMETGGSFKKHLHNGDPLTGRTVRVPAGRPVEGNPPFTWEESARDALIHMRWHKATDWTVPAMLFRVEAYNGFGHRMYHPEVLTPYLWSCTQHYEKGKYAADGKWDPELVSQQVGAAVILKGLMV